jgi:hypothetical protein
LSQGVLLRPQILTEGPFSNLFKGHGVPRTEQMAACRAVGCVYGVEVGRHTGSMVFGRHRTHPRAHLLWKELGYLLSLVPREAVRTR